MLALTALVDHLCNFILYVAFAFWYHSHGRLSTYCLYHFESALTVNEPYCVDFTI